MTKRDAVQPNLPHRKQGEDHERQQLAHLEDLLAWRQSLMEEVDRTVSHMNEIANLPDPSDRCLGRV